MKYKYRIEVFSFLDYAGLERHLGEMAAKGWQLESIGRTFWKYRQEEPAALRYSVTYIPEASVWDPQPTEAQQALTEFCAEVGWKKVCDWAQMQIFCSDRPDPTPIETDEAIRLDIIRRSMKKNILWGHGVLAVVCLLNILLRISNFMERPLDFLSDSGNIWVILTFSWSILLMLADVLYYWLWVKRSEKNIREGGKCAEAKGTRLMGIVSWLVLIPLVFVLLSQYEGMMSFMLLYLSGIFLAIFITWETQKKLRERGVSKGKNIALTLSVDIVLVLALTGFMVWYGVNFVDMGREAPRYYTSERGYDWPIYHDNLPLTVEDLMVVDYADYNREMSTTESIFLRYDDCRQDNPPNGDHPPCLNYEIYTVKFALSHDFVMDAIEKDELRHYTEDSLPYSGYIPVDATEWNADEAYQLQFGSAEGSIMDNKWLIRKGDVIFVFQPFFELANEMKPIITEKIAG